MKNKALIVLAAIGIGADASSAAAQSFYGSDTLFEVTRELVDQCPLVTTSDLDYKGGGSSLGGKAMTTGDATAVPAIPAQNQQIAPQSRFLKSSECGSTGQSMVLGLDAIGVWGSGAGGPSGCRTLRHAGAVGGLNFNSWRDALRLLYSGQGPIAQTDACVEAAPATTPATAGPISRCDSADRRALIANWNVLFDDSGCSNGSCSSGLRHAFRRDDLSGTTDTFLSLLGLPGIPSGAYNSTNRPFCNGNEFEDLDPVRTTCSPQEDVCQTIPYANRTAPASNPSSSGGDLGVVLAVTMPSDTTKQYGPGCGFGKFAYAPMPFSAALETQRCPDGNGRQGGKCRWPQDVNNKFNCLAVQSTRPPIRTFTNMDGRSYNLLPRDPDTGTLLINPPSGTPDTRWMSAGAYRIHQKTVMTNAPSGTHACTESDATLQIGCTVQADPCSIGYAGLQADQGNTNVIPLNLHTPDNAATSNNAQTPGAVPAVDQPGNCAVYAKRYGLARRLYLASAKGFTTTNPATDWMSFPNLNDGPTAGGVRKEQTFMKWVVDPANKATVDSAVQGAGYVKVNSFTMVACPGAPAAP